MRLTARVLSGQSDHELIADEVEELLAWKPNFISDGPRLIRNYVKLPDIRQRIAEGLRGAGILLEQCE